jgi:hypothetical protein
MKSGEIKFIFILILGVVILLSSFYFVSAVSAGCCIGSGCRTLVEGNISSTNENNIDFGVGGAKVTVECEDKHNIVRTSTQHAVSSSDGSYYVVFCSTKCDKTDTVTVTAKKDDLSGENSGSVESQGYINVALVDVDVPLVPEFGVTAGIVTVLGAVGTFFVIRKKHHVRIKRRF